MIRLIVFDLWQTLAVKDVAMRSSSRIRELIAPDMEHERFVKLFERTLQTRVWERKEDAYMALCEATGVQPSQEVLTEVIDIRDRAEDAIRVYWFSVPLLEGLRSGGYMTGLLSNSTCYAVQKLRERTRVLSFIDRPVFSFDVGAVKPERRMYGRVMQGFAAEEVLMIGDKYSDDVEPARELGMHAIHFTGYESLLEELEKLGVDITQLPRRENA